MADRPDNAALAEMLARESERHTDRKQKALRRAARKALMWPEEVADVLDAERSLTELAGVGPFTASVIRRLVDEPPPEERDPLRTGFITLAHARRVLTERPLLREQFRGDLQVHTTYSDGSASIEEMARRAAEHGHRVVAITDHSKGLKIANGMHEDELVSQWDEIAAVNGLLDGTIRCLRAIEMNLSPQGEGDMDPAVLARLDLVLGAFHSKLRITEDQTDRYLAALANPTVDVLAHPRGRIWNFRAGLRADWARVCAEAVARRKALEVDCYPDRQDLNVELLRIARDEGCLISVGTDAHHPDELAFFEIGIAAIELAEFPRERVLNYMPVEEVLAWTQKARASHPV